MKRHIELKPIRETPEDWDALEAVILKLLREEIYAPLIRELGLPKKALKNSLEDVADAIQAGTLMFERGKFTGRFTASISRELRKLGAKWSRRDSAYLIQLKELPVDLRTAIAVAESRFERVTQKVKEKIEQVSPEEVAEKLKAERLFDRQLWRVEKEFQKSVKNITVAPKLTPEQARRIASEYTNNLQLYIRDFVEKETQELRKRVQERSFQGLRVEGLAKEIQASYGVTANKARFLARQETSLMMTKFKQTRYQEAGVNEYIWTCVKNPKDKSPDQHTKGNVRYYHGLLDGKTCRWDNPPVTDADGNRKNPGQDYNCRCFARPIVRF